jgi:hypothetical protein
MTEMERDELAALLKERLEVIGDSELRARDPAEHLRRLQEVSERIEEERRRLSAELDPRLGHFLERCSYAKALDYLESSAGRAR